MGDLPADVRGLRNKIAEIIGDIGEHVQGALTVDQATDAILSALTAEGYIKHWRPIKEAPRYKPVWVRMESGWECVAEWRARGCSGMCVPPGQKIHTPHLHDEWLVVNEDGADLHPVEGYEPIHPTHYAPLLPAPESE